MSQRYHNRQTQSPGSRSFGPGGMLILLLLVGPTFMALINWNWQWLLLYLPIIIIFGM